MNRSEVAVSIDGNNLVIEFDENALTFMGLCMIEMEDVLKHCSPKYSHNADLTVYPNGGCWTCKGEGWAASDAPDMQEYIWGHIHSLASVMDE